MDHSAKAVAASRDAVNATGECVCRCAVWLAWCRSVAAGEVCRYEECSSEERIRSDGRVQAGLPYVRVYRSGVEDYGVLSPRAFAELFEVKS